MITRIRQWLFLGLALCAAASPSALASEDGKLPIPRFVSLRSDEVNLRTGPGVRYPVDWVYSRREMPVEVLAEHEGWRKIRDWEGTSGWVHQTMLSGRRTLVVQGAPRVMRETPADDSRPLASVQPGVQGKLLKCPRDKDWCKVELAGIQGWLRRGEFWGLYPTEFIE